MHALAGGLLYFFAVRPRDTQGRDVYGETSNVVSAPLFAMPIHHAEEPKSAFLVAAAASAAVISVAAIVFLLWRRRLKKIKVDADKEAMKYDYWVEPMTQEHPR